MVGYGKCGFWRGICGLLGFVGFMGCSRVVGLFVSGCGGAIFGSKRLFLGVLRVEVVDCMVLMHLLSRKRAEP